MAELHSTSPTTNDTQWTLLYKIAALIEAQGGGVLNTSNSNGAAASHVIPGALTLKTIVGFNNKGSNQYIQVFDSASLPADGEVPLLVITANAGYPFTFDFPNGRAFVNGLVVCNSSTVFTKTIGSADCNFDVTYE